MTDEQMKLVLEKAMADGLIKGEYIAEVLESAVSKEEETATDMLHTAMCIDRCRYIDESRYDKPWEKDEHKKWLAAQRHLCDKMKLTPPALSGKLVNAMNILADHPDAALLVGLYMFRNRYQVLTELNIRMPIRPQTYSKGGEVGQ